MPEPAEGLLRFINSPTLADAIAALSLHSNLQVPFISYGASVDNDWFSIRITPLMDLADQHTILVECALLLLQHVIEYVVGHPLADAQISVDYPPPPYADQYDDFFGCPVVFEQERVQLAVPRAYQHANSHLDLPSKVKVHQTKSSLEDPVVLAALVGMVHYISTIVDPSIVRSGN